MSDEQRAGTPARLTLLPAPSAGVWLDPEPPRPGLTPVPADDPEAWLHAFAGALDTGEAAEPVWAIPDLLAIERSARRMLCQEEAAASPALGRWRGLLALLLLWDGWPQPPHAAQLTLEDLGQSETPFAQAVRAGMTPRRRAQGLKLFALRAAGSWEKHPLALLSPGAILAPAADPGDLSALLPETVTWYDVRQGGFLDPCPFLPATERARLTAQLRLLLRLHEDPALHSPLYQPGAPLTAALHGFLADLQAVRLAACRALYQEEPQALRALEIRVKACCALCREPDFQDVTRTTETLSLHQLAENPLTQCFLSPEKELPAGEQPLRQVLWRYRGIPFALEDDALLFAPAGHPAEAETLRALGENLLLLENCSPAARRRMAQSLTCLMEQTETLPALLSPIPALLAGWRTDVAPALDISGQELHLTWPPAHCAPAFALLLREYLGGEDTAPLTEPFAPVLTLVDDGDAATLGDAPFAAGCMLPPLPNAPACAVIPPLSAAVCQTLAAENAPCTLDLTSLLAQRDTQTGAVSFSFALSCAARSTTVVFHRRYSPEEQTHTAPATLPTTALWPGMPVARWRSYTLYAHHAGGLSPWALSEGRWQQGALIRRNGRVWQVLRLTQWPAFLLLRRGGTDCGALPVARPGHQPVPGPEALIGLELGQSAAALALRQGERCAPARLERLQSTLLCGACTTPRETEFLPDAPLPGVRCLASERFTPGETPLMDGHLCVPAPFDALCVKEGIGYGAPWQASGVAVFALRQLLEEGLLAACLTGAPCVRWRIALPAAASPAQRQQLQQLLPPLIRETCEASGLPLTAEAPIDWLESAAAEAAFFQQAAPSLVMDVGCGSTQLLSLSTGRAAVLPLGMRTLVTEPLRAAPSFLLEDFDRILDYPQVRRELRLLMQALQSAPSPASAQLLIETFLGENLHALTRHMEIRDHQGRCTHTQGLWMLLGAMALSLAGRLGLAGGASIQLAGRGSLWLQRLSSDAQRTLTAMLQADAHFVPSPAPKQEIAQGLLADVQPDVQPITVPDVGPEGLTSFLQRFFRLAPQAAEAALPGFFQQDGQISPAGRGLLAQSCAACFPCAPGETPASLARALGMLATRWAAACR